MTIKEKLEAMRAIEDKNHAVDQAFILGQQSVPSEDDFYNRCMGRLKRKHKDLNKFSQTRREEAYLEGLEAAMSILHDEHKPRG